MDTNPLSDIHIAYIFPSLLAAFSFFFKIFPPSPHSMWGFSSLIRDQT